MISSVWLWEDDMYNAFEIADYLLSLQEDESFLSKEEQTGERITPLKLQKLLYYCQGFFLAITDKPLFKEKIVAWPHGPVVLEIWEKYKDYQGSGLPIPEAIASLRDTHVEKILKSVYKRYGQYGAWKLRDMTHDEEPWQSCRVEGKTVEIPNEVLRDFFTKLRNRSAKRHYREHLRETISDNLELFRALA